MKKKCTIISFGKSRSLSHNKKLDKRATLSNKPLLFFTVLLLLGGVAKAQCYVQASAGEEQNMAIKSNGTLWGWGLNDSYQLGYSTSTNLQKSPVQIGVATDWAKVSEGENHGLGIKTNGTLFGWGDNHYGQLGNGTTIANAAPAQIGTDTWAMVDAGYVRSFGIKTDGTLWAWGANSSGELGDGTIGSQISPRQIGIGSTWKKVATTNITTSYVHTLAIKSDGTLWAWGDNHYGQIGNGVASTAYVTSLTQIASGFTWIAIACGDMHTLAVRSDGTLWAWGDNTDGALGIGSGVAKLPNPTQVGTDANWANVAVGETYSFAIKTDGTLWGWGTNNTGQLGNGTTTNSNSPVQVSSVSNWVSVDAGFESSIGIANTGLYTWGDGTSGQLGNGLRTYSQTPFNIGCSTILPVSLTDFAATKQGTAAMLNWNTATESNNKGFTILRSTDGQNFSQIGFVNSLAINGHSADALYYSFTDATPVSGTNFYKLQQTDLDGRTTLSNIAVVNMLGKTGSYKVYPNPASSFLNIETGAAGTYQVELFANDGRKVQAATIASASGLVTLSLNKTSVYSGVYIVKITGQSSGTSNYATVLVQ